MPTATPQPTLETNKGRFTLYLAHFTPHLLFAAVFLAALALYSFTLAPGVGGGDAGEHQFAAPLLGIPHTTGYPLYILLGKLWTMLIPISSMAWRMNLFSALWGALAAGLTGLVVYYLANGESANRRMANNASAVLSAFVAGLTLAVGLTLWQWSVIAGVRSMNVFFFALLTLEAILWQRQIVGERSTLNVQHSESILRLLALTIGLSLAHHRTTVFFLPSLALWVISYDPHLLRQPKRMAILALLALAPLSLYGFIYLRGLNHPPYTHELITDFQSFWFLVGSGDSQGLFLSIDPAFLPARLAFIWQDLLTQLSWLGVILAVGGGVWLLRQWPRQFFFQALLVVLLLLFTLDFEVVNLNEAPTWYLMPAYFILAVWVGLGIKGIYDLRFTTRAPIRGVYDFWPVFGKSLTHYPLSSMFYPLTTLIIIALLGYTLAWPNWQTIYAASTSPMDDWRQLLRGPQAERFVESSLPEVQPDSIIWGDWEQYTPLKYYQLINGWRPDVTVRNPLDRWPEKVAAAHAAGQPVYFTRKPADLIGTPYLTMVGPLIYLQTAPQLTPPDGLTPLKANFENELELIGYRAEVWPQNSPGGQKAGEILQLRLYWRVPQKTKWDYALSLRLIDSTGQEFYKKDALHPVLSSYPTSLWTPGEVVGDYYELPLPPEHGPFTLHLLPYRTEGPGQWHNLTLNGAEGIIIRIAQVATFRRKHPE